MANVANFPQSPGQPVWAIAYNAGANQLVRWDGVHVGTVGPADPPCVSPLASAFLTNDGCAAGVVGGTPYDMNDPAWKLPNGDENRDTCAYKFFAGLHMAGYNTEMGKYAGATDPQVRALKKFQADYALPVTSVMTVPALLMLDAVLVARESKIASVAHSFALYDHMQPLHPHDVSKDWVAFIYTLPMTVLPANLQLTGNETLYCIKVQCVGSIQDANGNDLGNLPEIDLASDYRFVGAYFDPNDWASNTPSAALDASVVLHEFAHYIDRRNHTPALPNNPTAGRILTDGFYNILYDIAQAQGPQASCAPPRSGDPSDWITKYAFSGGAAPGSCPAGTAYFLESFADSFMMYVAAGTSYRAAAAQNDKVAATYEWLKVNVFEGKEYDTEFVQGFSSGCNDAPGIPQQQPAYASCSEAYVWNAELKFK
jgi:hypothetical protein